MRVGKAWIDMTPSEVLPVAGQMHVRYGEFTHDPLTVNAVLFDDGQQRVALLSCDLICLPDDFVKQAQARCESELGIDARRVLIACTHTHVAPQTRVGLPGDSSDDFLQSVEDAIVDSVRSAAEDLQDVQLYCGAGFIEQMGFNRRGMHKDGTCDMYYGSWNEDFAGVEGPRDGEVSVLFAIKSDGRPKVVVSSFSTHPNCLESESFYSADVPGAVRRFLRRIYGPSLGVIYLTGAAGNTAPTNLEKSREEWSDWRGERGLLRSGRYLGAEIVKVMEGTLKPMGEPVLRLAQAVVPIPIREYPADFKYDRDWGREIFERAVEMWPKLIAEQSPVHVRLNALRIGDAVICTNPAELYVEFGLEIKRNSPARVTLISELTDGYVGYVATREAYSHGGYSTWPLPSCKLAESAGETIVEVTTRLLADAFAG